MNQIKKIVAIMFISSCFLGQNVSWNGCVGHDKDGNETGSFKSEIQNYSEFLTPMTTYDSKTKRMIGNGGSSLRGSFGYWFIGSYTNLV